MVRLPWRKFQDFYLRLGFLKLLVAILDPHRRPSPPEVLAESLHRHVLRPLASSPSALEALRGLAFDLGDERSKGSRKSETTLAEALLVLGDCPSNLYAITAKSAIKMVEWGHDFGLLGRGNQITDRGLVLRALLPAEEFTRFLRGEVFAWNPFVLSPEERAFFLYQLCEIDGVTVEVLDELAEQPAGMLLETAEAGAITCRALFKVLDSVKGRNMLSAQPQLRASRELACAMALELNLHDLTERCGSLAQRGPGRVARIPGTGSLAPARAGGSARRTTKNTDHQTIPRFEQLVDIGFLVKPGSDSGDRVARYHSKASWRYATTPRVRQWGASRKQGNLSAGWEQSRFASVAASSVLGLPESFPISNDPALLAQYLWEAWLRVRQPIGHTPLETIALLAMIEALSHGRRAEMADFHALMMRLKRTGAAHDEVFFAGGNEIAKMFVHLRQGFIEAVRARAADLVSDAPPAGDTSQRPKPKEIE